MGEESSLEPEQDAYLALQSLGGMDGGERDLVFGRLVQVTTFFVGIELEGFQEGGDTPARNNKNIPWIVALCCAAAALLAFVLAMVIKKASRKNS